MFGTRDVFRYWECAGCGCVSLLDEPPDLAKYYPSNYYSMQVSRPRVLRRLRDRIYMSPLSFLVNWRKRSDFDAIRTAGLTREMRLLDVGCGAGHLLTDLRQIGYQAVGVDPFVASDIHDHFGVRVRKGTLDQIPESYDVILFRHSLEHMPRQLEALESARSHLTTTGICVVCIPIIGWAWEHYGTNWSQLDAPRHTALHSLRSFELLASKAGFTVERVVFDSDEFQFWVSELYKEDKPLVGSKRPSSFATIRMRIRASALNRSRKGDKAQFYLRPN